MPYVPTWLGDIRRYFPRDVVAFLEQEAIERRGLTPAPARTGDAGDAREGRQPRRHDHRPQGHDAGGDAPDRPPGRRRDRRGAAQAAGAPDPPGGDRRPPARPPRAAPGRPQPRHAADRPRRPAQLRAGSGQDHPRPDLVLRQSAPLPRVADRRPGRPERLDGRVGRLRRRSSPPSSPPCRRSTPGSSSSTPASPTSAINSADPVEVLFGVQLGGGTDIARAVAYAATLVEQPEKTIFLLITDLFEGGDRGALLRQLAALGESRVNVLCVLALNDAGVASYDHELGRKVAALGIPTFAATPNRLVEAVEKALRGEGVAGGR